MLFKICNKPAVKAIYNERIFDMPYDQFIELLNYCFHKPHKYLVVGCDKNLYHKQSNQLVINNNDNNKKMDLFK